MKFSFLVPFLAFVCAGPVFAQKPVEAYGKIFHHASGQRTETQKMGNSNQVRQDTYNKDGVLSEVRTFDVDEQGRLRNGVIYDGRKKPVASTRYTYDPSSNALLVEELFNTKGKRVRILYYPGALKDPKFAKRMVAFSFDPDKPTAEKVEIKGEVKPIVPVTQSGGEFEPGIPQGTAAPTAHEAVLSKSRSSNIPTTTAPLPKRTSWFKQKKN